MSFYKSGFIVRSISWVAVIATLLFSVVLILNAKPPFRSAASVPLRSPAPPMPLRSQLETSPERISLGSLSPGETKRSRFTLTNPGLESITIERVTTSCPCVEVGPVPVQIRPGKTESMEVKFDPAEEPEFRGRLSIEVSGLDPAGSIAFRTHIGIDVRGE
jgi:Protein of unknown function (DUF1573)